MQLAYINLPRMDNDGAPTFHAFESAVAAISKAFGGCTVSADCRGVWRDNDGTMYDEVVAVVSIAANWDAAAIETLREIARVACRDMAQVCVFVAFPHGVEFIDLIRNPVWEAV